jgi:hypothetical protein
VAAERNRTTESLHGTAQLCPGAHHYAWQESASQDVGSFGCIMRPLARARLWSIQFPHQLCGCCERRLWRLTAHEFSGSTRVNARVLVRVGFVGEDVKHIDRNASL